MSDQFKISLPDGSVREMPQGSTPADVAAAIGPGSKPSGGATQAIHHAAGILALVDCFFSADLAGVEKIPKEVVEQHHAVLLTGLNI